MTHTTKFRLPFKVGDIFFFSEEKIKSKRKRSPRYTVQTEAKTSTFYKLYEHNSINQVCNISKIRRNLYDNFPDRHNYIVFKKYLPICCESTLARFLVSVEEFSVAM